MFQVFNYIIKGSKEYMYKRNELYYNEAKRPLKWLNLFVFNKNDYIQWLQWLFSIKMITFNDYNDCFQ